MHLFSFYSRSAPKYKTPIEATLCDLFVTCAVQL
jgi:hypothetical protein